MKKFILITILILIAAFVIFNYIAANEAEKQIDKAIQMQADSSAIPFSVQYSNIDVAPFSGNIDFSDVTIVRKNNIERAGHMHIDLRYIDFLNIYFGGLQYGLEQISSGTIHGKKVSYVDSETMQQISLEDVNLKYQGNMWDGMQNLFWNQPLAFNQKLDIAGSQLHYGKPVSSVGAFKSDSVFLHLNFPKTTPEKQRVNDSVNFKTITWTPPADFQQKYGFFIQGFGFKQDAIPVSILHFSTENLSNNRVQLRDGQLKTNLFTIRFNGTLRNDSTWSNAELAPLNISIVDLSQKFKNVLQNVEQLLGTSFSEQQNKIDLQLVGPLTNPRITHTNQNF